MTSPFWPGTNVLKSQRNAFTSHLDQPHSDIRFKGKTGPKPTTDYKQFAVYSKATPKEGI
jgi:hypothetical protein